MSFEFISLFFFYSVILSVFSPSYGWNTADMMYNQSKISITSIISESFFLITTLSINVCSIYEKYEETSVFKVESFISCSIQSFLFLIEFISVYWSSTNKLFAFMVQLYINPEQRNHPAKHLHWKLYFFFRSSKNNRKKRLLPPNSLKYPD